MNSFIDRPDDVAVQLLTVASNTIYSSAQSSDPLWTFWPDTSPAHLMPLPDTSYSMVMVVWHPESCRPRPIAGQNGDRGSKVLAEDRDIKIW